MKLNTGEILDSLLKQLTETDYIHPESIPEIDLYMDQVTTFMDGHLAGSRRHPEDKILTKTMINNYAKNHLLPPPEKKKYTKEHMLLLIFIYYFKGILSIADIQTLLSPLTEKFFSGDGTGVTLTDIYQEVFSQKHTRTERLAKDLLDEYEQSLATFQNAPGENREELQFFSLICFLSFDVYMKKQIIERLLDRTAAARSSGAKSRASGSGAEDAS